MVTPKVHGQPTLLSRLGGGQLTLRVHLHSGNAGLRGLLDHSRGHGRVELHGSSDIRPAVRRSMPWAYEERHQEGNAGRQLLELIPVLEDLERG